MDVLQLEEAIDGDLGIESTVDQVQVYKEVYNCSKQLKCGIQYSR